ncbi:MAG: hypothetical protein UHN47_06875 [Lachnospiraceae bacterium]|nr:hypothetical protein [Lachnospiraceae bacterium]
MRKITNYIIVLLAVLCIQGIVVNAEEELPSRFDYIRYAEENQDLKQVYGYDKDALYEHYINIGKGEGRIAHFEGGADYFDYRAYLDMYPELEAIYGRDYKALYIHYITIGMGEGRKAYYYANIMGSKKNKTVVRNGSTFTIEGYSFETTKEPYEHPSNKWKFNNPDGGFPIVYEYYKETEDGYYRLTEIIHELNRVSGYDDSFYSFEEFIHDGFDLFTDEEKLAYISYVMKNNKDMVFAAFTWLVSTDYFTLEEKINIIKDHGMCTVSDYYVNWIWDVYSSKLPNGSKVDSVITKYFRSVGNPLHSIKGTDGNTYAIPEKDVERYRSNGAIKKINRTVNFMGAYTQEMEFEYVNPAKIDCERWYRG